MKRTKYDAVFSDLVRERVNYTCESCGRHEPEGAGRQAIHCSHFKSRAVHSLRYHPWNACCLCASCHKYLGEHPDEHTAFHRKVFGAEVQEQLTVLARRIMRRRKADLEAMHRFLKGELARIRQARAEGETGRIEFEAFD